MEEEGLIVRLRGLPWSASQEEVANFLEGCNIVGGLDGVHFTYVRDGRPSGEAYVEMETEDDLYMALKKDKHHMGKRYIDVFQSKRSEMDWVVKRSGGSGNEAVGEAVIRLRGLPFGCSKEEIAHFFSGLEIVPNGITLLRDPQGRTTGDAFVQFASPDIAEHALSKHKGRIGHRYIEIFKSGQMEVRNALNMMNRMMGMNRMGSGSMGGGGSSSRPGPYDRGDRYGSSSGMGGSSSGGMGFRGGRGRGNVKGFFDDGFDDFGGGYGGSRRQGSGSSSSGGMRSHKGMSMLGRGGSGTLDNYESQTGHCVHMRGLPFAANEQDILDFFKPLNPVNVFIHVQSDGRASGEADVDFATHDEAKDAMSRDRATMQHRYIELFLRSTPAGNNFGGGYGNGMSGSMGGGMSNPNYTAF